MFKKPYLNQVHYKSDNAITYLSGGINNINPPEFIQDAEVADMYNFCLDDFPSLRTSVGRTMLTNPGIRGQNVSYFGIAGLNYLFYIQNGVLKDDLGNGIVQNLTGTEFYHVSYKDGQSEYLIVYGTQQKPIRMKLPLSALNPAELLPMPSEIEYPDIMCYHKYKLFAAKGDMLYWSGTQNVMDWSSTQDSGALKVPESNGDITGLKSYDDKLVILTQNNMHELYGDSANEGGNLFSLVSLDNDIGCYGQRCICVHNDLMYWLYGKSIYEYNGASIKNIESPSTKNGVAGGIKKYLEGILYSEAKQVSIAGSDKKIYFFFPNYQGHGRIFIFDQYTRKWTQDYQAEDVTAELYYVSIADSFNNINFSQTPVPVYALTNSGTIYEITGGRRDGNNYIKTYGEDEFVDENDLVYKLKKPFYLKTKTFFEGGVSKKKALKEIWISYNLATNAEANVRVTTNDNRVATIENVLEPGQNKVARILIPHELENMDSYYIEIYGKGDISIKLLERQFRLKVR